MNLTLLYTKIMLHFAYVNTINLFRLGSGWNGTNDGVAFDCCC